MNKHSTAISAMCALFVCVAIMSISAAPISYEWGTDLVKIKKSLPSDRESTQFTPRDKPNYKNKILSYITAIDAKLVDKIIILRLKSKPVVDYLFVNDKLYTVMENWGEVDQKTEKDILAQLSSQFGGPLVQQDKNFYIYSFNSDKTKVLYYLMKLPNGKSKCKVYYYTKQLFRMLITE
jgi:hypothetical protein